MRKVVSKNVIRGAFVGAFGLILAGCGLSNTQLYDLCVKSTAYVQTSQGTATGFVVSIHGRKCLYTCEHCLTDTKMAKAKLADGSSIELGDMEIAVGRDLVRFVLPRKYEGLELADDSEVSVNDAIIAFGDTLGEGVMTANEGRILAYGVDKLEVDAGVLQGNSGGPVVTRQGKVVGVVSCGSVLHDEYTKGTRYDKTRRFAERVSNAKWIGVGYSKYLDDYKRLLEIKALLGFMSAYLNDDYWRGLAKANPSKITKWDVPAYYKVGTDAQKCLDGMINHLNGAIEYINKSGELTENYKKIDLAIKEGSLRFPFHANGIAFQTESELRKSFEDAVMMQVCLGATSQGLWYVRCEAECNALLDELRKFAADYSGLRSILIDRVEALLPEMDGLIKKHEAEQFRGGSKRFGDPGTGKEPKTGKVAE